MTAIGYVPGATVRRTAAVPAIDSSGISVLATQPGLLGTLGGSVARGTFLNSATGPGALAGCIPRRGPPGSRPPRRSAP